MPYKIETIKILHRAGMTILPGTKIVIAHEGVARGLVRSGHAKGKLMPCTIEGKAIKNVKPSTEPVSERQPVEDGGAGDEADQS